MHTCDKVHNYRERLSSLGIRPTKHRLAVLATLHEEGKASAEELAARPAVRGMDRVTVYRTLKQLMAAGVVYEAQAGHAGLHYELVDHHTHVVKCVGCGVTADMPAGGQLEKQLQSVRVPRFAHVHAHSVAFFGTCNECARVVG